MYTFSGNVSKTVDESSLYIFKHWLCFIYIMFVNEGPFLYKIYLYMCTWKIVFQRWVLDLKHLYFYYRWWSYKQTLQKKTPPPVRPLSCLRQRVQREWGWKKNSKMCRLVWYIYAVVWLLRSLENWTNLLLRTTYFWIQNS